MSKLGDRGYFRLLLAKEGFDEGQADAIIDIFIKGMQDKLLEEGNITIPMFGKFKANVLPARYSTRLQKDVGETFKVTFTPSRNGLIARWNNTYSAKAKQDAELAKLAKQLKL